MPWVKGESGNSAGRPANDLTGQRFGRLEALERAGSDAKKNALWLCRCDCGARTTVASYSLRHGHTQSCGCLHSEGVSSRNRASKRVHGLTKAPTYIVWVGMKQRTLNPKATDWESYGGRGITVCERWRKFENFLADMGERPEGLTLDRIDNDGGYEPGNCRWTTWSEQRLNQRRMVGVR